MEISQHLNTIGAASTARNDKGAASDSSGFAQLYQQMGARTTQAGRPEQQLLAGSATNASNTSAGTGRLGEGPTSEGELLDADPLSELGLGELNDEALADPALLAELETALQALTGAPTVGDPAPGAAEIAPLAQHIAQALGASALSDSPISDETSPQHGTQPLGGIQPLDSGDRLDLAAIRQRLELIAGTQRGDATTPPQWLSAAMANSQQPKLEAAETTVASLAGRQSDVSSQRHQQLTALGMQAIAGQQQQAQQTQQAGNVQPANFADAVTTIAGDDVPLSTRGSSIDNHLPAMPSGGSHASGTAAPMSGQPQGASVPTQVLSAPLASAQWQQGLGQQLVSLHQRGAGKVELHLHPAELGPLTISLKVDDQLAQAQFFSANPQVRAAVEQAIPQLREALEESGIQLGEAMVGEHQQQNEGNARSQGESALASSHGTTADGAGDDETLASETPLNAGRGLDGSGVDLYA